LRVHGNKESVRGFAADALEASLVLFLGHELAGLFAALGKNALRPSPWS
jgi:hypothetical protein